MDSTNKSLSFPSQASDEIADPADTLNEYLRDTSREPSSVMSRFLTHRNYKLINVFCFKLHICGKFIAQQYITNTSLFYSIKEKKNKIHLDRNCAKSARTQNTYGPNSSSTSFSSSEHCLNVPTRGQQAGQSRDLNLVLNLA